ncbi:MAG: glycosyltransferase family 4 protein [Bacteroidota bacterium]
MNRILFIKKGKFSNINDKITQQLHRHFGDNSVEVLDIVSYLKGRPLTLFVNILFVIKEYGRDFLSGRKQKDDIRKVFFSTVFLFKHIKKMLKKKVVPNHYIFTFQTQSLHDCSSLGTPHFVYTDYALLVDNYCPDISIEKYTRSRSYTALEKCIYKNATKVFVLGGQVAQSLVNDYQLPESKVVCVGAGYNIQVSNLPTDDARYAKKKILFVGIDWERKGGPLLIEAFQRVLAKHPDAHLTIVGSSPKVTVPNCEVVGKIPLSNVPQYFEQASVFCMPSIREPFGIVYIEAMLYRLPVVALNRGATSDFIQPGVNGFLVENTAEDLADALDQLLQSPTRCRSFGEKGYDIAHERYSWNYIGGMIKKEILSELSMIGQNGTIQAKQTIPQKTAR